MFRVLCCDGFKDLVYYGDDIGSDEIVYTLSGSIVSEPTQTSIQIAPSQHIEDKWGQYINHSCNPTVKVVGNKLISVKEIKDGQSITFDYNETETLISHPFVCHCCGKLIKGKSAI